MNHTRKLFFLLMTLCYAHATLCSEPKSSQGTPAEQSSSTEYTYHAILYGPKSSKESTLTVNQREHPYTPKAKYNFIEHLHERLLEEAARNEPYEVAWACLRGALIIASVEDNLEADAKKHSEEAEKLKATMQKQTEKEDVNLQPINTPSYKVTLSGPKFKLGSKGWSTPSEGYLKQITQAPIHEHINALHKKLQSALSWNHPRVFTEICLRYALVFAAYDDYSRRGAEKQQEPAD